MPGKVLMARLDRDKDLTLHALLAMLRKKREVEVCCDTLWRFLRRCGKRGPGTGLRCRLDYQVSV
jgi:transposase